MIKAIMSRIFASVVGNSSEKIMAFGFSPSTKGWWGWGWSSPWIRLLALDKQLRLVSWLGARGTCFQMKNGINY